MSSLWDLPRKALISARRKMSMAKTEVLEEVHEVQLLLSLHEYVWARCEPIQDEVSASLLHGAVSSV